VFCAIKNGIQEVVGSIPSSSTNEFKGLEGFPSKPFFVGYTNDSKWLEDGFTIRPRQAVC